MSNSNPSTLENLIIRVIASLTAANTATPSAFTPSFKYIGEFVYGELIPGFPAVMVTYSEEKPVQGANYSPENFECTLMIRVFGNQVNPDYIGTEIRTLSHQVRKQINIDLDAQDAVQIKLLGMKPLFFKPSENAAIRPVCELRYQLLYKERFAP